MSETDPWKVAKSTIRARIADYSVALLGHSSGSQQAKENAQTAIDVAIDAARAAEAAQHRQEIAAKDEMIRQQAEDIAYFKDFRDSVAAALGVENEQGPVDPSAIVEAADSTLSQLFDFSARLAAVEAERDRLKAALLDVTTGMDRAGGDRDGMPECPWCQSQGDYDHSGDCALVAARAALTPQGQSTDGETR